MSEFVVRAADEDSFNQAGILVAQIFSHDNPRAYERILHDWVANLAQKPRFHISQCRVGMLADEVVSQVLIEKDTLYYGGAQVRVAGISRVCTQSEYRHQGYSSTIMLDALATIAEQGAHLALLNDLSGYYHNFGFSPVLPDTYMEVDSLTASQLPQTMKIRSARPNDLGQIAHIYERHWSGRVSFQRTPEWWIWQFKSSIDPVLVVVNHADLVQGYLWRDNSGEYLELVTDSLPATMSFLSFLGKRLEKIEEPLISLYIPPDDTILSFVRQMMSVNVRAVYKFNRGWMARIIDSTGLLNAILPEITAHAKTFFPNFDPTQLYLTVESDAVTIGLHNTPESRLHLTHRDFVQVMFGSLRPSTLALRDQLPLDAVHLLELLFPPRIAAIAPLNWF